MKENDRNNITESGICADIRLIFSKHIVTVIDSV